MVVPGWTQAAAGTFVVVALVLVATFHVIRLVHPALRRRVPHPDVEIVHAVMALAMIAVLTLALGRLGAVLGVAFAAVALCFGGRAVRDYVLDGRGGSCSRAGEMTGCAAMSFMLIAAAGAGSAGTSMGTMAMSTDEAASGIRLLGDVLLVASLALAVSTVRRRRTLTLVLGPAPALGLTCRLTMSAVTAVMLAMM